MCRNPTRAPSGVARGIRAIDSAISLITTLGAWPHTGYKAYLDLQAYQAVKISGLALGRPGWGSEGGDPDRPENEEKAGGRTRRATVTSVEERGPLLKTF